MPNDPLDLRFGPGPSAGFTPSGIATFHDLQPAAVVRELIQNSLDAAAEANEKTAIVRFRHNCIPASDIPGIESYREEFRAAVKSHMRSKNGKLPSQAQRVVMVMAEALAKDNQETLCVLDNGIGLNKTRLSALLSDGVSEKGGDATGTFGNGHSVAIPASDLRYVLYGGLTENGKSIGAGHAVIASRIVAGEKYQRGADGFLVHGFKSGTYKFAEGPTLPRLITNELDEIRESSGRGSAVIIPAFNNFRERKKSLWEMIARAASCNFFQAIEEERLEVWFEDIRPGESGQILCLDRSTLAEILKANRTDKRSRAFLSGEKAYRAHEVLQSGECYSVQTHLGEAQVQLLFRSGGSPRVDLCRNGMWITDDKNIPGFYYAFQDRRPFHALLLLDASSGDRLWELVRNAEGPLHDKLDVKQRLGRREASALRKAFGEIRNWLKKTVPKIGGDSYSPDDFLALDFGGESDAGSGKARRSFWGTPTPIARRDISILSDELTPGPGPSPGPGPGPGPRPEPNPRPGPGPVPRPVLRSIVQAVTVPVRANRRLIQLECRKNCENAELRLRIDENTDATCDLVRRDATTQVFLSKVKVNGQAVADRDLVRKNGRIIGVRLGDLAENTSVRIDSDFELPNGLSTFGGQEPALRVEVFKAPTTKGRKL